MSKELEALESIKKTIQQLDYGFVSKEDEEDFKIIETALKNYQELLERPCVLVGRTQGHTKALINMISKNYKEIKITNLDDEKKLKAFDIIKEKWVNADLLMRSNYLDVYNMQMRVYSPFHKFQELTQEEYDLLKEVLNNGK